MISKDRDQNVVLINAMTLEEAMSFQGFINTKSKNRIAALIANCNAAANLLVIRACSCEKLASLIERIAREKGILCRREFKQQNSIWEEKNA